MKRQEQHNACSGNLADSICLAEVTVDTAPKSNDGHRFQKPSTIRIYHDLPLEQGPSQRVKIIDQWNHQTVCLGNLAGSIQQL